MNATINATMESTVRERNNELTCVLTAMVESGNAGLSVVDILSDFAMARLSAAELESLRVQLGERQVCRLTGSELELVIARVLTS